MSDVWAVGSLTELRFLFFLSSKFLIGIFLKLQLPPESNKKFPANFYFLLNFCSRQKVYYKMEMAGHFFCKRRVFTKLIGIQVKDFWF